MVSVEQIKWAPYNIFEGPFFIGTAPVRSDGSELSEHILATITATEGGRWNAINMYDKCICTVGAIQWCEGGQYSVSDMLGVVRERDASLLNPLAGVMREANVTFAKNARGRWRFFFQDGRGEVDRVEEQRQLFLLHSTGQKGSWDDESKAYAKRWAAALATLFEAPEAIAAQRAYTVPRLFSFALPAARAWLDKAPSTPVGKAFVCAFLSYAANNPKWANESLAKALGSPDGDAWSPEWLAGILRELTFHPKITIYPTRYNAIRPVLERLFGIDLPNMASELVAASGENWLSTSEVQMILVALGYDIGASGPKKDGVDNVWGGKCQMALSDFQRRNGLDADGWPDPETNEALCRARDAVDKIRENPADLRARVEALVSLSMAAEARAYFDQHTTEG